MAEFDPKKLINVIDDGINDGLDALEEATIQVFDFARLVANIIQSPPDPRDIIADAYYELTDSKNLPKTLDLRSKMPRIRNQGIRGTCAGFAAASIKEYQERIDCGYDRHMSPEYLYFYRSNKPQEGMYPRDLMKILKNKGCCTEKTFPYQIFNDAGSVPAGADDEASDYKIKGYARVNTVNGLKMALYKDGPCLVAFPVYNDTPEFWKGKPNDNLVGGHAVSCVGYTKEGFIIRNSWGPIWNGDGCVTYKYSDFGAHWEIYTTMDIKGSPLPDDGKPDPKPDDCHCALL